MKYFNNVNEVFIRQNGVIGNLCIVQLQFKKNVIEEMLCQLHIVFGQFNYKTFLGDLALTQFVTF